MAKSSTPAIKPVRCAIYTRVSTEHGLDQEFNSLDAQHEAASAYIKSQTHAGWTLIRSRYDDGGYSGGSTDRPALQQLLDDIRNHKIDVIVVYKVDRLTRSLADFAKLVELFDTHGVSFASVTQPFNTTTSMGRLTLNVLLSFAQFEREVTSERIRDKIAASKRKGLWVGGPLPLGYIMNDGRITVIEEEAETVRFIFQRYLELSGVNALMHDLRERGVRSKFRSLKTGGTRGGVTFGRGALFYLLRNRFYIGEVAYKGEILPGEQPPILDRSLFEAVQQKLRDQWSHRNHQKTRSEHLLAGLLFDDAGHCMIPTHTTKARIRYRYYVSGPHLRGESGTATLGSISRVPAHNIEGVVLKAVNHHLASRSHQDDNTNSPAQPINGREELFILLDRIEVHRGKLLAWFKADARMQAADAIAGLPVSHDAPDLVIPWHKPPSKKPRQILLPEDTARNAVRPERAERRVRLVAAIARGRRWLDQIVSGSALGIDDIAGREQCSIRQVNMTISLAFLAPDLVKAAVEGRLPRGYGIERLRDAPTEWHRQFEAFGLNPR
jgi:DNA invertase Pin-like site-specific DNA recombinase